MPFTFESKIIKECYFTAPKDDETGTYHEVAVDGTNIQGNSYLSLTSNSLIFLLSLKVWDIYHIIINSQTANLSDLQNMSQRMDLGMLTNTFLEDGKSV